MGANGAQRWRRGRRSPGGRGKSLRRQVFREYIYVVTMREICSGRLTVTFIYCTDIFYLHLADYIFYINNLCSSDIEKNIISNICYIYV